MGYRAQLVGTSSSSTWATATPSRSTRPRASPSRSRTPPALAVTGIDKELVGHVAARVRATRKPEPYKGKGVRYAGEVVRRKAGKAGKIGGKTWPPTSPQPLHRRVGDAASAPDRRRRPTTTMATATSRTSARQKRHARLRLHLAGYGGAAAPGGLPQPQADLCPGHRRHHGPHARQRLLRSRPRSAGATGTKTERARQVGALVAERARAAGIERVVFDRAGFRYHGRINSLAEGARESGLDF